MSHTKTVDDPPTGGAGKAGSTTNPCFEIGITMAGAVSAGAYTAGAVDFLIEALDAWYAAKEADENIPQHDISLNVLTGASAGSIVAAILAVCLNYRFPHCRAGTIRLDDDNLTGNPLYDTWVKQIDLLKLLTSHDLSEKQPIRSLLDSTCLTELTTDLLNYRAPTPDVMDRRYVSDTLEIIFTINNLRGVPYSVPMMGNHERGHDMTLHAATASFSLIRPSRQTVQTQPGTERLIQPNGADVAAWHRLGQAALASSAFPIGLAPRVVTQPITSLDHELKLPGESINMPGCLPPPFTPPIYTAEQCIRLKPTWPEPAPAGSAYSMLCVDGGTFNNEPFELARQALAGLTGRNPRGGLEAKCAVLMIDPLPEVTDFKKNNSEQGILATLSALIGAWTNNSRFKPEEIALALQETIYSRFIMTPSRRNEGEPQPNPVLASGPLAGFAGFLNVKFRHHDYMLGRRNCQRFLEEHFSLPAGNPLFAKWTDTQRDRYAIEKAAGRELPIIPLMGQLRSSAKGGTDEPLPTWPGTGIRESEIKTAISERVSALLNKMLAGKSWLCRRAGSVAIYFIKKCAAKEIVTAIVDGLENKDKTNTTGIMS